MEVAVKSKQLLSQINPSFDYQVANHNCNTERKAVNFQILSSIKSILVMIHNQLVGSLSSDFCTNYDF